MALVLRGKRGEILLTYPVVLVCDVDMNVIKTLEISNFDKFSGLYSDYDQKMICVYPSENKVFYLTLEGVLVSIDQYYNITELADPNTDLFIERGSMLFLADESNTYVWYYLQVLDDEEDQNTFVYKYSTDAKGSLAVFELENVIAYDIAYIPLLANYKVYLSTDTGREVFTHELTRLTAISPYYAFDHMQVMNNLLFTHKANETKLRVFQADGTPEPDISGLSYEYISFMLADDNIDKLYLTGYNATSAGVEMIEEAATSVKSTFD